ncbi:MAG: phosphate-starvation-inducible PsiE family protein [Desulfurococcales archaeon]|nr:phosphate-starvation-inducible PsiE family protein [Desulfurococcales archaeon]
MSEQECQREKGYRVMRNIIDTLEIILAIILAATILIASVKLVVLMYKDLVETPVITKTYVLEVLDMILLLVLAIDILRTLLTAVVRRRFPIRIVVEAAMLAILREIISVEIRHLDWPMLIALGVVFFILAFMWILIGKLESSGVLQEAIAS